MLANLLSFANPKKAKEAKGPDFNEDIDLISQPSNESLSQYNEDMD